MVAARPDRATWLVTNGRAVVGPVSSRALLDGLERGVVGPDCLLRQPPWAAWRSLSQVREVSAWFREPEAPGEERPEDWLEAACDRGELLHLTLLAALRATGASLGVGYLRRRSELVATCFAGDVSEASVGTRLGSHDPVLALALRGAVLVDVVGGGGPEARAIARRLGGQRSLAGVALLPVLGLRRVLGVVELGRADHPFRQSDRRLLERIAWAARWRAA